MINNEVMSALSHSLDAEEQKQQRQQQKQQQQKQQQTINNMQSSLKQRGIDEESAWENSVNYGAEQQAYEQEIEDESLGDGDAGDRGVESLYADLSCLCLPTCAKRPGDICSRSAGWALANADQFISSIIVAISLIPESISYALIAGLPPSAALQSCWISNVITAMVGGRPGMITSASGLAALLLFRLVNTDTVVEESGVMFVPYVIIFAGILQCCAAFVGLGRLVSTFPAPVVVGMVNAMALLILALQCRYAKDFPLSQEALTNGWNVDGEDAAAEVSWNISIFSYFGKGFEWIAPWLNLGIYGAEVGTAFMISMFLPKLTTFLPATLVSVLVVVAVEFGLARQFGVETPLIGDYGGAQVVTPWETIFSSKYTLPSLTNWESWKLILGYGFSLFATQFTETAIALNVVDRLDESQGPGFLVLIGQGVANIVTGLMGGMGGAGVVSMSVLADRTFGTTCLSTFMTGLMMFVFVTWGYPVINFIPLSAISGISIAMVCSFVQWRSMVATFTTCLPSSKRDRLPPQYNIARWDVFVMLLVTAACLIVDVATLLFFVMGLGIFAYTLVSACWTRRKERKAMNEEEEYEQEYEDDGEYQMEEQLEEQLEDQQDAGSARNQQVYEEEQYEQQSATRGQSFPEVMEEEEEEEEDEQPRMMRNRNDLNDGDSCPSWDCRVMESAEDYIFPQPCQNGGNKRSKSRNNLS